MMTAKILQFPGVGPMFGGTAFTANAVTMARDAIALSGVPEDIFWHAVCVLAESPDEADRARALQIWAGYVTGFQAEEPQEPFVVPESEYLADPASLSGEIVASAVAMFIGSAGLVFYLFGGGLW